MNLHVPIVTKTRHKAIIDCPQKACPLLPPKQISKPAQRELLALFRQLDDRRKDSLLDYARYLARQDEVAKTSERPAVAEPMGLPRPENETVIAAIRRLSRNYPMLDGDTLLHQASALMSAHVLQGRNAPDVIDELEQLFAGAYRVHCGGDD